ncbi:MAG: class I adenylate-forming enzyme family protein [Oligoflexales bacterium]
MSQTFDFKDFSEISNHAFRNPNKPAVVSGSKSLSYGQLENISNQIAKNLKNNSLDGEILVTVLPHCTELVSLYFACFKSQTIISPLNFRFKFKEFETVLRHTVPKVIVIHEMFLEEILKVDQDIVDMIEYKFIIGEKIDIHRYDDWKPFHQLSKYEASANFQICLQKNLQRPALIFHTSGTIGIPKGVLHTMESAIYFIHGSKAAFQLHPEHRTVVLANCFHSGGFCHLFAALVSCSSCYLPSYVSQVDYFDLFSKMSEYKINHASPLSSTCIDFVDKLFDFPEVAEQLEFVSTGGDKTPAIIFEKLSKSFNINLTNIYGSTEAGIVCANHYQQGKKARVDSIGQVSDSIYETKIVDPNGKEVKEGETGELWIRGKSVFKEYYGNSTETVKSFGPDRWYKSGDLVYQDEQGYLHFQGRCKMMIVRNTSNIFPHEIEEVLYTHSAIEKVAVLGKPHPKEGEEPIAFVCLKSNADSTSEFELLEYLKPRISEFKIPARIYIRNFLPETSTRKIDRKSLLSTIG